MAAPMAVLEANYSAAKDDEPGKKPRREKR
jgi:hypothetical protein